MVAGDFSCQDWLSQHRKDVRLVLAEDGRTGARLPLSELHTQFLKQPEAAASARRMTP